MDNDNYFLTQEGNLDDSGICGDTAVDELMHFGIDNEESDCFGDLPVSYLVHTDADVENDESYCFGDIPVNDLVHADDDEEYCFGDIPVNDLMHSGIKGMRWGVRRYQNPDGSLTPAGKKRYNKTLEKVRAEEKKLREKAKAEKTTEATRSKIDKLNARVDAVNRKKQALKEGKKLSDEADNKAKTEAEKEAEKKAYEESKAKAIKSGSATEVLKYKGDLTPQEMQSVTARLQWEQNMQGISAKELAVGKNKVDRAFETIDKTTERAVTAAKAWNMAANVVNAVAGLDVSLPKIDTNIGSGNKETRDKEKKAKKDADPKEKSALEKLKEETAWIDAQNKNREAKRAARRHDEADAKEAAKKAKQDAEKAKTDDWSDVTISDVSAATQSRGQAYIDSVLALPAPRDDDDRR